MPETRTATISTENREVFFFNKDAEKKHLGTVYIDTVEGEGLKRQFFQADPESPYKQEVNGEKRYKLGMGSDRLTFVDPAQAVEPLLNMGWQIKSVMAHRGGSEIMTTLVNPAIKFDDPFTYDQGRWLATDVHGKEFVSTISTCLTVRSNLHVGFLGAMYSGGLHRLVCSNLAEAEVLGLPSYAYRHNTWNVETVSQKLAELGYAMNTLEGLPTGPIIGTMKMLGGIRMALTAYRDEIQGFKSKSGMFDLLPKQIACFNPIKTPDWTLNNFLAELSELEKAYEPDYPVTALMILNAYTNAINWHNQAVKNIDRGTWSAIANASAAVGAITEIGKFISFFNPSNYQEPANVYNDLNTTGTKPNRKGYKVITVESTHNQGENQESNLPIKNEINLVDEPNDPFDLLQKQLNNVN
jgi:hypothetical protein